MAAPLDTDVAIETPEHIVFHYRLAGPARRAVAYLIDLALCYGIVAALGLVVVLAFFGSATSGEISSGAKAGGGLVLLALFAAQWVWFVVWEATRGQSPGKRWTGIRVVADNGRPIGWRAAAIRNLLRAADALQRFRLANSGIASARSIRVKALDASSSPAEAAMARCSRAGRERRARLLACR